MLIGISGTLGSGKTELGRYLIFHGFKLLKLKSETDDDEWDNTPNVTLSEEDGLFTPEVGKKMNNGFGNNGNEAGIHEDADVNANTMEPYKVFGDAEDFLDFVTKNWRENFVLSHIDQLEVLEMLSKRPFFLHVSMDAPMKIRFNRYLRKKEENKLTLEQFIEKSDRELFSLTNRLIEINNRAHVKIINTSVSIKDLHVKLNELNLTDPQRLRPNWDSYFMSLADLAALRSNCMKRRVGCVIVRENRVVATGYNGTPMHLTNCNEGGCERCNSGNIGGSALSTCLCLHAEENALIEAGRDRIRGEGVLYCNTCPCLTCSIKIIQSGIKEVVYAQSYFMDSSSHRVMSEAKINLRQFEPPTDGVFI